MNEGGKLYERTKETAEAVGFYDNMRKLIPAVRAAHIQVIIVPRHRWGERDYKGWKHMNQSQIRRTKTRTCCIDGKSLNSTGFCNQSIL
jgi:hypothetical protein